MLKRFFERLCAFFSLRRRICDHRMGPWLYVDDNKYIRQCLRCAVFEDREIITHSSNIAREHY